MNRTNAQIVDLLGEVWSEIASLGAELDPAEWEMPTDCPGWDVKDQFSHMIGTESFLLGRPAPSHKPAPAEHVKNPIGESNEIQVDFRRSWPPEKVLEEFEAVTSERLEALAKMTDSDFAADSWTPVGRGTYRDFMEIRVFDCWVHEQDIRRAVERPGDLDSGPAQLSFERCVRNMPYIVGKKAGAPEGASVVFEVSGPMTETIQVTVVDGRAERVDSPPVDATTITADTETFIALGCGRWTAGEVTDSGKVSIAGDVALGERVLQNMGFMV